MKKLLLVSVLLGSVLTFGCGGDDKPTEPPGPTIVTVTAASGSTAPTQGNVNDPVWSSVASTNVPIAVSSFSSAAKLRPDAALAVASSVAVQALVVNGADLYLRFTWDDASWDCWPGKMEVTSFQAGSGWAQFTRRGEVEDHLMVFFDGGVDFGWDCWHWRMATTGGGYLAEGAKLNGTSLTVDPGANAVITLNQEQGFTIPLYMHPEERANQSYQLFEADAVPMVVNTDSLAENWQLGDMVPGWVIDGTLYQQSVATRGDRFDIDAYSDHDGNGYVLVMKRALSTGSMNDLNLSLLTAVNVRIGITNNSSFLFNAGSTNQGFSNTFKLNLP